jgi:hypothetical protein
VCWQVAAESSYAITKERNPAMSISSISSQAPPTTSLQKPQTPPLKTSDPDHDGDVDKAGAPDVEKSSSSSVNIKA